jgi:DNA modification methylase
MPWHPDTPEEYRDTIVCGDARRLAARVPDESIDLVYTDPVYQNIEDYLWLANQAERVLKPGGACLMWQGQQWLAQTIIALAASRLTYRWVLGWYASNNMQMVGKVARNIVPLLWYEKGHSNPHTAVREVVDVPIPTGKSEFAWSKRPEAIAYYLGRFCVPGQVVWDPFAGMGTLPLVCTQYDVHFIASEIDPERVERGMQRIRDFTPPLLQPPPPEQYAFEIEGRLP